MPEPGAALGAALPPGVALGAADPLVLHPLWPGETPGACVPARLREFSAGRAAARAAMARLNVAAAAIPAGPDRAPVWPPGLVGSISHCAGACLAVLARDQDFRSLGLDLEPLHPIEADLWPSLLTPGELERLRACPQARRGLAVLRHFVAKEAAFKAQYRLSGALIGFDALEIAFADLGFTARFAQDVPPFSAGTCLPGRLVATASHLAAFVWMPA